MPGTHHGPGSIAQHGRPCRPAGFCSVAHDSERVVRRSRSDLQFTGMLIDLLPTLLGYAQISPTVAYQNAPDNHAGSLVNGSWTGTVLQLTPSTAALHS